MSKVSLVGELMKLKGRESRRPYSFSPYMSPMASVMWWLSSLMEICGAWPRRAWYKRSSSCALSEDCSGWRCAVSMCSRGQGAARGMCGG